MLKQHCHTLSTNGACGSSFTQDQDIRSQVTGQITDANQEITTLLGRAISWVVMAFEIKEERRTLSGLTSEQISDIGVSQAEVRIESQRAYWDFPLDRNSPE